MYVVTQLVGRPIWLPFLIGQISAALALWFVWKIGCEFTTAARSLTAVLLLSTVTYFGMHGIAFNHNTAQLWSIAASIWLFYHSLRSDRIELWIALGVMCGLALLTTYSAMVQFAAFALFLLRQQQLFHVAIIKRLTIAASVLVDATRL